MHLAERDVGVAVRWGSVGCGGVGLHLAERVVGVAEDAEEGGEDLARRGHRREYQRVELRQRVVHKVLPDR